MERKYLDRIRKVVSINKLHYLNEDDVFDILNKTKPMIFDGHFELISENHSDMFFRFAPISLKPFYLARISKEMTAMLRNKKTNTNIDVVISPASQGMFFAYDIARELNREFGTRAVYTTINEDTGYTEKVLVKGFEIKQKEKVLIVNDMTSTGKSLQKFIELVQESNAQIVGICVFADLGIDTPLTRKIRNEYDFHTIIKLIIPYWNTDECDLCKTNDKLVLAKQVNNSKI